ncbi:MAG: lipid-A-disaccharide synthase N-terminal domain-containing protein [Verrucomicrobiales bacterium]|jgi:lipid-A-disaccharide synthase-like uncharacterized protein|nr:lipid-A-disaccharide synthase N-terminal domain-containing protein [Verrucomicrobiales bacterium]
MSELLWQFNWGDCTLMVTGWKIIGWFGALMFGGRWAVQALVSHFAKRPVLPIVFWYMSFVGSACALSYYIWGKNDSVGILMTAFPCVFTLYNIFLHFAHLKRQTVSGEQDGHQDG